MDYPCEPLLWNEFHKLFHLFEMFDSEVVLGHGRWRSLSDEGLHKRSFQHLHQLEQPFADLVQRSLIRLDGATHLQTQIQRIKRTLARRGRRNAQSTSPGSGHAAKRINKQDKKKGQGQKKKRKKKKKEKKRNETKRNETKRKRKKIAIASHTNSTTK